MWVSIINLFIAASLANGNLSKGEVKALKRIWDQTKGLPSITEEQLAQIIASSCGSRFGGKDYHLMLALVANRFGLDKYNLPELRDELEQLEGPVEHWHKI